MELIVRNIRSSAMMNRKFGRVPLAAAEVCSAACEVRRLANAADEVIPIKARRFNVISFLYPMSQDKGILNLSRKKPEGELLTLCEKAFCEVYASEWSAVNFDGGQETIYRCAELRGEEIFRRISRINVLRTGVRRKQ